MVHKSCQNLRVSYVSGFDQIIKDNKDEVMNEIASYDSPVYLNVQLPESIDEASEAVNEIEEKISSLLDLQKSFDDEIAESKKRIAKTDEERQQIEQETMAVSEAMQELQDKLNEYGDYVERYKIKYGDHSHENSMRNIGRVADFATILIPGEAWVSIGGKILKGSKVVAEGAKAVKHADTIADIIRGVHMLKKQGMESRDADYSGDDIYDPGSCTDPEVLRSQINQEKAPGVLDLLSLEYYFSKIGKKFDVPDTVVVDENYRRKYEEGRKAITDQINAEARRAAENRIAINNITDKKEQEEIFISEQNKRKAKLDEEIRKLKNDLEKEKVKQFNSESAKHYIEAAKDYITEFCNNISDSVLPMINEKFEAYVGSYGIEIEAEIANQKKQLEELENKFKGSENSEIESELEKCRGYISVLS